MGKTIVLFVQVIKVSTYILRRSENCDTSVFMKQYVIDELRFEDFKKIKTYLDDKFTASILDGIYWIPIEKRVLTDVQSDHLECHPFFFAMRIEQNSLSCELLVRTRNRIRCECMDYANEDQRNWLIRRVDSMFDTLNIKT